MAHLTNNQCSVRLGEEVGTSYVPRQILQRVMLSNVSSDSKAAVLLTESELNELIRLLGGYRGPDMALKKQWIQDLQSLNKHTFKAAKRKTVTNRKRRTKNEN
jgi:hypothetical protein